MVITDCYVKLPDGKPKLNEKPHHTPAKKRLPHRTFAIKICCRKSLLLLIQFLDWLFSCYLIDMYSHQHAWNLGSHEKRHRCPFPASCWISQPSVSSQLFGRPPVFPEGHCCSQLQGGAQ